MNNIEWKENAVCYADGKQWVLSHEKDHLSGGDLLAHYDYVIDFDDFQLNEPMTGDYLPKSELDTERKYNDAVEELGLFGFEKNKGSLSYGDLAVGATHYLASKDYGIDSVSTNLAFKSYCKGRKLTYNQLIAIGKLKRMMLERAVPAVEFGAVADNGNEDKVKSPSHYQLIEGVESIEVIARSMTQEQFKGYCLGNTLKYRLRAGKKDALQQDIDKANFYGELYEMHKGKCYD